MVRKWIITGFILLLASQASSGEPLKLKTEKDRVNYSIGVNLANTLKLQGADIDVDLVVRGLRDSLTGGPLLLNDEETGTATRPATRCCGWSRGPFPRAPVRSML